MKQSDSFFNKRFLFLMLMVFAISINVNAKKVFKYKLEVTSELSDRGKKIEFSARLAEWKSEWIQFFQVFNKTNERIFIEWENARILGDRVVFSDDRRITMNNPKADEAVSPISFSIRRDITSARKIGENYIFPLFYTKNLKKNLGEKSTIYLKIPIRYLDNTVEEFNIELTVWFEDPKTNQ